MARKASHSGNQFENWVGENRSILFWILVAVLVLVVIAVIITILPYLIILAIIGVILYFVYKGKLRPHN